ncbi:MAG: tRNA pseudouridine(55) synthase TruB [Alphaproteobacteria bacterium]
MAQKKVNKINGWINLDKPYGMGSTQALSKVRRLLNAQKAGHAGTLDPLATGVLPIALGEATKFISYIQDGLKEYAFTITWGEQRDTDDGEGKIIATSDVRPSPEQINTILKNYIGDIEQVPPQFSAVKLDGTRAYDIARGGEIMDLAPRTVFIQELKILHPDESQNPHGSQIKFGMQQTSFNCLCGKGTYIRSLARDMGAELGTCGYISALKRLKSGPFTLETAISLDRLGEIGDSAALTEGLLIPLETALDDIPALAVKEEEASRLRNGQILTFISRPDFERLDGLERNGERTLATSKGKAVAIVEIEGPEVRPVRVINT